MGGLKTHVPGLHRRLADSQTIPVKRDAYISSRCLMEQFPSRRPAHAPRYSAVLIFG